MTKLQAWLGIAALLAAPLALFARAGCASPPCTMLCCLHQPHPGAMGGMADCRHETPTSSPCAAWGCSCPHGSAAVRWLPLTPPSFTPAALPAFAGVVPPAQSAEFVSAYPPTDTPPPRS